MMPSQILLQYSLAEISELIHKDLRDQNLLPAHSNLAISNRLDGAVDVIIMFGGQDAETE